MEFMIKKLMLICVEVMDVVNVVLDGIDVVMFLGEMVNGDYLVEMVKLMVEVCLGVEIMLSINIFCYCMEGIFMYVDEVVVMFVMYIVNYLEGVFVIIVLIYLGEIVKLMSCISLGLLIFVLLCNLCVLNCIVLYCGVIFVFYDEESCIIDGVKKVLVLLKE